MKWCRGPDAQLSCSGPKPSADLRENTPSSRNPRIHQAQAPLSPHLTSIPNNSPGVVTASSPQISESFGSHFNMLLPARHSLARYCWRRRVCVCTGLCRNICLLTLLHSFEDMRPTLAPYLTLMGLELIYKIETDSQTQQVNLQLPEGRRRMRGRDS